MSFSGLSAMGLSPATPDGLVCIAGPCAAESREQVLEAAVEMKRLGVSAFRAGVWKPRTRPGNFEGAGIKALEWLKEAKRETGLPVATEVASAKHVAAALEAGVDLFWIGARSCANPFAVQEIANALASADIPVLVKNPLSTDLNLWIGALERIMGAGVSRIAAVLRGFSHSFTADLRNEPGWHIAIDLKQKFPSIPILCDPSHMAGRRDKIFDLAQQALNLDFDGLLMESHPHPEAALSDAEQQLTPQELGTILQGLKIRKRGDEAANDLKINALRTQIDELDAEILAAVAKRMDIVREIGILKREQNLTVLQSTRWNQVLGNMLESGRRLGLPVALVESIAKQLHQQAIELQQAIISK